jgi:hypothetical protein
MDLPQFCAAPLITYCAAKKMNHVQGQVQWAAAGLVDSELS